MNEPSESDRDLERLMERTLRRLPLRRAPLTLESRVLGELQRRAALPWWRHSFAQWPPAARAAFVLLCAGLAGLVFRGGLWAIAGLEALHQSGMPSMPWARQITMLTGAAGELAVSLVRAVPPDWVYEGLALSALLYTALFGLAAAAYRTLYLKPEISGDLRP
jgi:hypothetical protein